MAAANVAAACEVLRPNMRLRSSDDMRYTFDTRNDAIHLPVSAVPTMTAATMSEPPPLKSTLTSIIIPTPMRKKGMKIALPTKSMRRMRGDEWGMSLLSTSPVMKAPRIPSMPASFISPAPRNSSIITKMYCMTLSL